jgi:hypothetical protein
LALYCLRNFFAGSLLNKPNMLCASVDKEPRIGARPA